MPRKTPEERELKKKKYAALRAAGLTREQARAPLKNAPSHLVNAVKDILSSYSARPSKPQHPIPKAGKSKPKKSPAHDLVPKGKSRKNYEDFHAYLDAHPNKSASRAMVDYRRETGKSIADKTGYRLYREHKEKGKNYANMRFPKYGNGVKNPMHKTFLYRGERYYYYVRYDVEVENQPDMFEQYGYITSNREEKPEDVAQAVIEQFHMGQSTGIERYVARNIDPNSIVILMQIDVLDT